MCSGEVNVPARFGDRLYSCRKEEVLHLKESVSVPPVVNLAGRNLERAKEERQGLGPLDSESGN